MKPPPISDGTPNESVADVFFRVIHLYFAQELSLVIDKYSALLCGRSPIAVVEPLRGSQHLGRGGEQAAT